MTQSNPQEFSKQAISHAKRVIALGWTKETDVNVIAGTWDAGYTFGQIDAASKQVGNVWVEASERLPEVGHNKRFPKASKDVWVSDGVTVRVGFYEDLWCDEDEGEFTMFEVKYWMPKIIPEPPLHP